MLFFLQKNPLELLLLLFATKKIPPTFIATTQNFTHTKISVNMSINGGRPSEAK